jgi:peptidylprolyl isomerase
MIRRPFVATSRRRERELARRRFERRRQAELERRARAKRRNTVLGAVIGTVAVIVVVVIIGIKVFGGSDNKAKVKAGATPTPTATATTPAANTPAPKRCKAVAPNPPFKGAPHVPDVTGKAPKKLLTTDIKVGHGPAAKNGDDLQVFYTGVSCALGTAFDSSYKSTPVSPLPVTNLGSPGLIPGFAKGIVGMKAGGVREVVIPLAYKADPSNSPTFPNDTLIFVISVKSITPAK